MDSDIEGRYQQQPFRHLGPVAIGGPEAGGHVLLREPRVMSGVRFYHGVSRDGQVNYAPIGRRSLAPGARLPIIDPVGILESEFLCLTLYVP